MTRTTERRWKQMQTDETRKVEEELRKEFQQVDTYRYNSASIRVRVVDSRFQGKEPSKRDAMVERHLKRLPERIQADIVNLFTFAPEELENREAHLREWLLNIEFEDPSSSSL